MRVMGGRHEARQAAGFARDSLGSRPGWFGWSASRQGHESGKCQQGDVLILGPRFHKTEATKTLTLVKFAPAY